MKDLNLNVVIHSGFLMAEEAMTALKQYMVHPDASPSQMQLVDCTAVEDFERDYLAFMRTQLEVGDMFPPILPDVILCLLSSPGAGRDLACAIGRSWDGVGHIKVRFAENREQAKDILGLASIPNY